MSEHYVNLPDSMENVCLADFVRNYTFLVFNLKKILSTKELIILLRKTMTMMTIFMMIKTKLMETSSILIKKEN